MSLPGLAAQIGQSCVDGLDVDGGSISLMTATESRQTLWVSDAVAELSSPAQRSTKMSIAASSRTGVLWRAVTPGRPVR
jgi:hypothetical protein